MPGFGGYEAWIEINDEKVKEYRVKTCQENKKVICWIPCESGKEFRIGYTLPLDFDTSTNHLFEVKLDGNYVDINDSVCDQNKTGLANPPRHLSKVYFGDVSLRPLQFGTLELTDDEGYLDKATKAFGEISVSVFSADSFDDIPSVDSSTPLDDSNKVHERSKKGLTHCVQFGQEEKIDEDSTFVQPVGKKHVCTFVFKYRHIDVLVANEIAPGPSRAEETRAPQKAAGVRTCKRKISELKYEDDIIVVDMTGDDWEIQELETRLAALKKKKETEDRGSESSKRVKKNANFVPREVIDLTC